MLTLAELQTQITAALKAKDQLRADVLRGLKTRLQNEAIAKQKELAEADILALVKSELKRRKDSAAAYQTGNRPELAEKELAEAEILQSFLPQQMSETELAAAVEAVLAQGAYTAKDFGAVMGQLKAKLGGSADGALLAKLLKEKLQS